MIPVPQAVLQILCAAYNIDPQALAYLGGGGEQSEGVVYEFPYLASRRVLKIGALDESDTSGFLRLEERLKFDHYLQEHGANIVYPNMRADGSLFATARAGGHIFVAYTMDKASGEHPRAELPGRYEPVPTPAPARSAGLRGFWPS